MRLSISRRIFYFFCFNNCFVKHYGGFAILVLTVTSFCQSSEILIGVVTSFGFQAAVFTTSASGCYLSNVHWCFLFQNQYPESEELVFSHFVICNDTQETLRFGQVDTDENVLLSSQHSHQYSWRSHKSHQVLLNLDSWISIWQLFLGNKQQVPSKND